MENQESKRLNEREAKQIIMNAQMASYPAKDVPMIFKPLYQYVEDCEKEISELQHQSKNEINRAYLVGYEDGRQGNKCDYSKL